MRTASLIGPPKGDWPSPLPSAVLLDRESNGRNSGISLSVSRCCPKLLLQTKWRNGGGVLRPEALPSFFTPDAAGWSKRVDPSPEDETQTLEKNPCYARRR